MPEPTQRGIATYGPLPRRNADAQQQIAFVVSKLQSYVNCVRIWDLSGLGLDHDEADILVSAIRVAQDCGFLPDIGLGAGKRVWATAGTAANEYVGELRRKIWPLARAGSPGQQIMAAAYLVNDKHGCPLPYEKLLQAVRVIAAHAVGQSSGRAR